jgi:hypothetical protein
MFICFFYLSWQYCLRTLAHKYKYKKCWIVKNVTEHRGEMVNTPTLYSGDPEFKYRPWDRLSLLRVFVVFLSPSTQMPWYYLNLGHDRFLTHPFKFISHLLAFNRQNTVWVTEKAPLKITNKLINKYEQCLNIAEDRLSFFAARTLHTPRLKSAERLRLNNTFTLQ